VQILREKEVADSNIMRFLLFLFLYISLLYAYASAQQVADTLRLDDVEVHASRIYLAERFQPVALSTIDSAQIQFHSIGNISDLLQSYAPVYVRSNGPGGLATISQRGYSPSQTQVLWNGFQLNHAMLGLTDLSLIPSFAIEGISIASGNGNTSFGDKGGGTVALKTRQPKNDVGLSRAFGSFGQSVSESYAGVKMGKWSLGLVAGIEDSKNDFTYNVREFSNQSGGFAEVEKSRENNQLHSKTGILSLGWKDGPKQFSTILWAHDRSNEIPGAINGLTPQAHQNDAFLRWMSRYTITIQKYKITGKLYYNRQQLDFINPANNTNSLSTSTGLIGEVEVRGSLFPKLQLISAAKLGQSRVDATEYTGSPKRTQYTIQANPVWHPLNPLHVYGGIRLDYYSDFKEAYSANLGANVEVLRDLLFLKGQLSRNFVVPTFNDLYWPELGNIALKPESNVKYELSMLIEKKGPVIQNQLEFTLYDGRVEDGIRWLPGLDGQSRPQNLERLRLRGFEIREGFWLKKGNFKVHLQGMLLHSLAELRTPRFDGDQAVGKQLRYTPKWQVKTSIMVDWQNLSSLMSYNFTDERFSTADHSSPFDPLPPYRQANWSNSYHFMVQQFQISPQFSIQNIFNEDYSIVKDYPMPGRSYQFKLTLTYSFK
jgi:outer membrane cobalamin receptor